MRTEILILLDRSGSMEATRDDVIGGFNAMVGAQKKEPGEAYLTLIQFDTGNPYEVIYTRRPIQEVGNLDRTTFVPRGGTPLLDAIAKTIVHQGTRFDGATVKPEKVILVIFTDGEENSSIEYNGSGGPARVKALINRQEKEWGWTVTLIGANFDAISAAADLGIGAKSALNYKQTPVGTRSAYAALNNMISSERGGVSYSYTAADRSNAADGDDSLLKSVVDTVVDKTIVGAGD